MDVTKILAELKAEREQIEEAIVSLERLARGRGPRRGRPPSWMAEITGKPRRGRPPPRDSPQQSPLGGQLHRARPTPGAVNRCKPDRRGGRDAPVRRV